MAILIDGYNLLNAAGVEGRGRGTDLARARQGLLDLLAGVLSDAEAARTTIVFDSKDAPPGLPREEQFGAIRVLFAQGYNEADELIEELIQADNSPRQLLVVSSDHRLHRAARRRRARAIDSQQWLSELRRRHREPRSSVAAKPAADPDVARWTAEFSGIDIEAMQGELDQQQHQAPAPSPSRQTDAEAGKTGDQSAAKAPQKNRNVWPPKEGVDEELLRAAKDLFPPEFFADSANLGQSDIANPFPPGYGEDLEQDEEE